MLFTTKVARLIYEWKIENDKIEEKIKSRGKIEENNKYMSIFVLL